MFSLSCTFSVRTTRRLHRDCKGKLFGFYLYSPSSPHSLVQLLFMVVVPTRVHKFRRRLSASVLRFCSPTLHCIETLVFVVLRAKATGETQKMYVYELSNGAALSADKRRRRRVNRPVVSTRDSLGITRFEIYCSGG